MQNKFPLEELQKLEFKEILIQLGCVKKGHTRFYNGQHGDGWVDIAEIMKYPAYLDTLVRKQAEFLRKNLPKTTLIISPGISGTIIGSGVAKYLHTEYASLVGKGSDVMFHRRYKPEVTHAVCIVEDMVFSGNDLQADIEYLKNYGFTDISACCWVNRREEIVNAVRVYSLVESLFHIYEKEECPLCEAGKELEYEWARE